MKDIIKRYSR